MNNETKAALFHKPLAYSTVSHEENFVLRSLTVGGSLPGETRATRRRFLLPFDYEERPRGTVTTWPRNYVTLPGRQGAGNRA